MTCKSCGYENVWEHCYHESYNGFKKALRTAWIVAICCCVTTVVVTIASLIMMHSLLTQFEYVEETSYEITQDDGTNTAVIGEGNEVKVYGESNNSCRADDQENNSEILEEKVTRKEQ